MEDKFERLIDGLEKSKNIISKSLDYVWLIILGMLCSAVVIGFYNYSF